MYLIRLILLVFFSYSLCICTATADTFVVSEIKIEGLKRLADGTLLNYLPIVVGDPPVYASNMSGFARIAAACSMTAAFVCASSSYLVG